MNEIKNIQDKLIKLERFYTEHFMTGEDAKILAEVNLTLLNLISDIELVNGRI